MKNAQQNIAKYFLEKLVNDPATFQNQLKVATKVVLLLGGNMSCMFSRKAGVWIYHFSGSSKSYQRFPPCAFLVSCWNRAQTVFVGKLIGLVFYEHERCMLCRFFSLHMNYLSNTLVVQKYVCFKKYFPISLFLKLLCFVTVWPCLAGSPSSGWRPYATSQMQVCIQKSTCGDYFIFACKSFRNYHRKYHITFCAVNR